jgi:acetyl-CoA acetyltransferase
VNARDVAIVGVHATKQARFLAERTTMDVCLEAVLGALEDAGLEPGAVDGMAVEWPGPGGAADDSASWARLFGPRLHFVADGLFDCAGVRGVLKAAAAIAAGLCDVVVVGGGSAGQEARDRMAVALAKGPQFHDCWGAYVAPMLGLVAARHMHEFGTTPEQLATVAATIRNHGHANPAAVMHGQGPYSVENVLSSPLVASPFRLLDLCLVAQGGAAIVLTTAERARDSRQPPVMLLGGGMEFAGASGVNPPAYRDVGQIGRTSARRALAAAGVGPDDVDVFNLYDPTSFEVIRQLEVLGVCAEGEGGALAESGALARDGRCPTNLDGGMLAYTWIGTQQMTLKIVESVLQLRRAAGDRQVPDAEIAVATNSAPAMAHWEVAVLGRG